MDTYHKCTFQEGLCNTLQSRLGDTHQKGLSVPILTNFETGETRPLGVIYRASSKDSGIFLNHCPWCGNSLHEVYPETFKEQA